MESTIVHWDPVCLELARDFGARARLITTADGLATLLDDCVRALGFRYFALVSHNDLGADTNGIIRIDSYPQAWAERYIQRRFYVQDPVVQASFRTDLGFLWDEIGGLIRVRTEHREMLTQGRREGIGDGFTVPASIPGHVHGSCSFAVREGQALPLSALYAAQLVGGIAYQAARRLTGAEAPFGAPPQLTPRQHACLVLAALGKSNWTIGRVLGLRKNSVTQYLASARRRYGVATRVQLVAAALYHGEASFTEILR